MTKNGINDISTTNNTNDKNDYQVFLDNFQLVAPGLQNDPEIMMFYNNMKDRHIWIEGDIDWDSCSWIIKYIQWVNRVTNEDKSPIHIHICSNGGEVVCAFALYNAIKNSNIAVYTYNEGSCHSAAFFIFLAGTKRFATKYSSWIAHEGYGGTGGSYRESKAAMKDYDRTVDMMKDIMTENTLLLRDEIEKHFEEQQDWYIYPEDALKYGILTEPYETKDNKGNKENKGERA